MSVSILSMHKDTLSAFNIRDFGHSIQIVGLVFGSTNGNWIAGFPDEVFGGEAVFDELVLESADWESVLYQSDVLETEMIGPEKAIVRKSQRQIDQNVAWAVFERDGYRCRYCGRKAPLTVDHVDLWEAGGVSVEANLIASCRPCNRRRGRMEYGDWLTSPDYQKASQGLDEAVKILNQAVVLSLPHLKTLRTKHVRSR